MKKQTISVVMTIKNEALLLEPYLKNLSWADEIVVVDMNSTDNSVEIAKKYTKKIYNYDGGPLHLIPLNQQFGIKKATMDWVIILEPDLVVSPFALKEIRKKIESGKYNQYTLNVAQVFMDHPFLHCPEKIIKLLRRNALRFVDPKGAHEYFYVIEKKRGEIASPLLHYSHPTISSFLTKIDLYTTQDAKSIVLHKKGGFLHQKLTKVHWWNFILDPARAFLIFYVKKQYFREGVIGFVYAVLFSYAIVVERAKVLEIYRVKKSTRK